MQAIAARVDDCPKPIVRNPRRTRAKILRAGRKVFAAKGPDRAGVDEIAETAGVNKRMIYHYFGNKEGLYLAVLQSVYSRLKTIAAGVRQHPADLKDLLDGLIREYFAFLRRNPEFVRLLNWENSCGADGLKQIDLSNLAEPFVHATQVALRRQQENRLIRDDADIKYLLISCLGLCSYYFTNRHSLSVVFGLHMEEPDMTDKWVEHISRLVLEGVAEKNSPEGERRDTCAP